MESKLAEGTDLARGIVRITRHPFLWGVALWALVHLIVNGDLASFILFGSLLLLALGGTVAIDAKRRRKFAGGWAQFAQTTSSVPFAAILSGRNSMVSALGEIGICAAARRRPRLRADSLLSRATFWRPACMKM